MQQIDATKNEAWKMSRLDQIMEDARLSPERDDILIAEAIALGGTSETFKKKLEAC